MPDRLLQVQSMLTSKDVAVESPSGHVTKALLAVHKRSHTHFSFFTSGATAHALLSQAKDKFFLESVLSNVLSVLQEYQKVFRSQGHDEYTLERE
jgi:hypothetical protein